MALSGVCEGNTYSQEIVNGVYEYPLRCSSCFRLLKPMADVVADRYCLDVLPVLQEKSFLPLKLKCSCGTLKDQDFYSVSGASEKESINQQSPSQMALLRLFKVPSQPDGQISPGNPSDIRNYINFQIESSEKDSAYGVSIDIGDENFVTTKRNGESLAKTRKTGDAIKKVLLRKSSLQKGAKVIQFLLDHGAVLLNGSARGKSANEQGTEVPSHPSWRSKRCSSFDSRKVALFFSILSSIGTMVLIYLTLRIKRVSDGLPPV